MLTTLLPYQLKEGVITLEISLVTILGLSIVFFIVLLFVGIRNSYKLKAENDRLSKPSISSEEDNKAYRDFTEGHLYDSY